jgi:hypothetical protein
MAALSFMVMYAGMMWKGAHGASTCQDTKNKSFWQGFSGVSAKPKHPGQTFTGPVPALHS